MPDQKKAPNSNDKEKRPPLWLSWISISLFLLGIFLVQGLFSEYFQPAGISWTDFKKIYSARDIDHVTIINRELAEVYLKESSLGKEEYKQVRNRTGPQYTFTVGSIENLERKLEEARQLFGFEEELEITYAKRTDWLSTLIAWTFPLLLILGLFYFMTRRIKMPGSTNPFDFGKSKAKIFDSRSIRQPKFADVAGHESAKVEIMEIVDFLKNPAFYTKLGAKIPKGVILVGPPGTGKTLMARAVAGEAGVPFFSISGSEFVEMFVGVGASRVRDLFQKAKEKAPSIIFIDEIDAVGRSRGGAFSLQSNDEEKARLINC